MVPIGKPRGYVTNFAWVLIYTVNIKGDVDGRRGWRVFSLWYFPRLYKWLV